MLRAFVEELGHEYDELLQGSANKDQTITDEPDNLLLAVASSQIKVSQDVKDEDADEEEKDEDSDENDNGYQVILFHWVNSDKKRSILVLSGDRS